MRFPHDSILINILTMGVFENSVAINPMVFMIIIPMKNGYFTGNIPNIFRQTHMVEKMDNLEVSMRSWGIPKIAGLIWFIPKMDDWGIPPMDWKPPNE